MTHTYYTISDGKGNYLSSTLLNPVLNVGTDPRSQLAQWSVDGNKLQNVGNNYYLIITSANTLGMSSTSSTIWDYINTSDTEGSEPPHSQNSTGNYINTVITCYIKNKNDDNLFNSTTYFLNLDNNKNWGLIDNDSSNIQYFLLLEVPEYYITISDNNNHYLMTTPVPTPIITVGNDPENIFALWSGTTLQNPGNGYYLDIDNLIVGRPNNLSLLTVPIGGQWVQEGTESKGTSIFTLPGTYPISYKGPDGTYYSYLNYNNGYFVTSQNQQQSFVVRKASSSPNTKIITTTIPSIPNSNTTTIPSIPNSNTTTIPPIPNSNTSIIMGLIIGFVVLALIILLVLLFL